MTPPCVECPGGSIQLMKAKGKLTPPTKDQNPKEDTVPRWELQSMVTAGQLIEFVLKDVEELKHCTIYLWGDNKPALCWCSSADITDIYVFRRVSTLRNLCPKVELRYISSADNPADILTKPVDADSFLVNKLWWNGPSWLPYKHLWPKQDQVYKLHPTITVAMQAYHISKQERNKKAIPGTLSEFFNDRPYMESLRAYAYALRWRDRVFYDKKEFNSKYVGAQECDYARKEAVKLMQRECFEPEILTLKAGKAVKTGKCRLMQLFLDTKDILRCKSRVPYLLNKTLSNSPVLVNAEHPYIESYIRSNHVGNNCNGTNATYNLIKWTMHGPGLRKIVNRVIKLCSNCAIVRAIPYSYPGHPELPLERLSAQTPFCNTGVDICGPFEVRSGYGRIKMWICLFTCMVTRAVYLVPLKDMRAVTFLDALWELASRRWQPKFMYSDNGTNFTKAAKMLDEMASNAYLQNELGKKGIIWKFTPPYSAHQGGLYKQLIKILKIELDKMCGNHIFTEHNFRQNLFEVERIMNNRPLIASGSYEVITPSHLLGGGNPSFDSDFTGLDRDVVKEAILREQNDLPHLFRQTQERLSSFWITFWDQYLVSLRFSNDKMANKFIMVPKVGDVCIVWCKDPRRKWRKAVVKELISSQDGQIRQCKICLGTGEQIRPVNQLYSLELTAEKYLENSKVVSSSETVASGQVVKPAAKKGRRAIRPIPVAVGRPRRSAALVAVEKNREILLQDHFS